MNLWGATLIQATTGSPAHPSPVLGSWYVRAPYTGPEALTPLGSYLWFSGSIHLEDIHRKACGSSLML